MSIPTHEATATRTRHVRVYRSDGHFDEFDVPAEAGETLLDALRWIQLTCDPTLSLRHSCLHASCGTCGVRVNGREELACVCSLADLGDDIRVEPLANLPTRTDVVVDMRPFYDRLAARPLIRTAEDRRFVRLDDCLECALCVSACPVVASGFVGPAAVVAATGSDGPLPWMTGPDGVWQCTTCKACVDLCPAGIAPMDAIVDMRRALVERGDVAEPLQEVLRSVALQGNSYGKSARRRARWTAGLDFTIPDARSEPVEYLWFVGDFASFDERVQRESQRLARILHDAGVSFGLLYDGERNAGNDVRQIGEQGLFDMLVEHNLRAFADARFDAIFTTDPHSLNALRNDYPLDKPSYHHTELLAELAQRGTLRLDGALAGARVTYHDPCYLARYNGIMEAPRKLIAATGAELVEMPRHGTETFCCGAGGGRIWNESDVGERPSEQRIREAQTLGDIDYFVVSCPKDLTMYTAAAATIGNVAFEVVELTALLERALV
ncbi:MAG TPA: 2Fe-2S iron-sulfur cluster-binding protein [Solirubrobacter sp.]|nr:2Fe-2S iron-sulfur cluster-binding protein [Solirubrobacter sp.]